VLCLAFFTSWSVTAADTPKSTPTGIPITLPGGLIIVVGGQPANSKGQPVFLTAEQYKELLDRIEQLQAQVDGKQARPRSCELEGKVELRGRQPIVKLRATFKFTTTRSNAIVFLSCLRAHVVEAKSDDGKTPVLTAGEDGLRAQVAAAGDHTLRLELELALSPRGPKGAELGFEIGLPGSPITALSFDAPEKVRRYTLSTRAPRLAGPGMPVSDLDVEQPEVERFSPARGGAPLGPVTYLALAWDNPERKDDAVLSADADIGVNIGTTELTTEARLRLRGSATSWRFTAPSTADVSVGLWSNPGTKPAEIPADRAPNVIRPEPGQSVWRVEWREPTSSDLLITVSVKQPRPRVGDPAASGPFPIGPFVVLNVPRQSAIVRVRAPFNVRLQAKLNGDVQNDPEVSSGETVYRYRISDQKDPPKVAPVELTLSPVTGIVQTRLRHELRLTEAGWRLRSEISVSPSRTEVESIDIEVPSTFVPATVEPREIVEEFTIVGDAGPDRRVYRARLGSPKRASFAFTLEGDYAVPPSAASASLKLPRLLGVSERSVDLVVSAPPRYDLHGSYSTWVDQKPGTWKTPLDLDSDETGTRLKGTSSQPVAAIDLTWRVAELTASVRSEADVDVDETRIRVVHRLSFRFTGQPPAKIRLQSERPVQNVNASRGVLEQSADGWEFVLPSDATSKQEYTLTYWVPRSPPNATDPSFTIPLLLPAAADIVHHVRLWSASNHPVRLAGESDWTIGPPEVVPERSHMPSLVLHARGQVSPARVNVANSNESLIAGPLGDRASIEVRLGETEAIYRARFWIREWTPVVEFQLPDRIAGLEVYVRGKRWMGTGDDSARIRIPRPTGSNNTNTIEIFYRRPIGAMGLLVPPELSAGHAGEITWSIYSRPRSLTLVPGNGVGVWSPAALFSTFGLQTASIELLEDGTADASAPAAVIRQTESAPVRIYQVPRSAGIVGSSMCAFIVGLLIATLKPTTRRLILLTLALAAVLGAFLLPQPFARTTFAILPGLAAMAIVLAIFRASRRQYRRRLSRTPGFARAGSSLVRPTVIRPRDPSSRDAPPVAAPSSS
jgi:hypothetical protein